MAIVFDPTDRSGGQMQSIDVVTAHMMADEPPVHKRGP